jgi:hypothetical protein
MSPCGESRPDSSQTDSKKIIILIKKLSDFFVLQIVNNYIREKQPWFGMSLRNYSFIKKINLLKNMSFK